MERLRLEQLERELRRLLPTGFSSQTLRCQVLIYKISTKHNPFQPEAKHGFRARLGDSRFGCFRYLCNLRELPYNWLRKALIPRIRSLVLSTSAFIVFKSSGVGVRWGSLF